MEAKDTKIGLCDKVTRVRVIIGQKTLIEGVNQDDGRIIIINSKCFLPYCESKSG